MIIITITIYKVLSNCQALFEAWFYGTGDWVSETVSKVLKVTQCIRAKLLTTSLSPLFFTVESDIKSRVEKAIKYENCIHKFKKSIESSINLSKFCILMGTFIIIIRNTQWHHINTNTYWFTLNYSKPLNIWKWYC